jgi:arylsulfatase A-like enzyme
MNVILIVIDTLRYDYVGANGNTWIHTPNLDALARRGLAFDRCYVGSFPTIPCRWEFITGRAHADGLPFQTWRPLEWHVPTIPDVLREAGYVTMLLCDTPHLINHGYGFDRPFHGWDLIRGQEVDRISTEPLAVADLPAPPEALALWRRRSQTPEAGRGAAAASAPAAGRQMDRLVSPLTATPDELRRLSNPLRQYYRNRRSIQPRTEEDYLPARLFSTAARWLERNRSHSDFFLWIDCFDPHEPWDPPLADRLRYDSSEGGWDVPQPPGDASLLTEAERRRAIALYAGEVTLVDRWLGYFLQKLDTLGLADRTAVIVTSDHGTFAGQHGRFGKGYYLLDALAHQVLFLRLPGDEAAGTRVPGLVQPVDVARTILDLAAVPPPDGMALDGRSLLPLARQDAPAAGRELVFSGGVPPAGRGRPAGLEAVPPISVGDGRWTLIAGPDRDRWRLFDNREDPGQLHDRLALDSGVAAGLHAALVDELRRRGSSDAVVRAYAEAGAGGPPPEVLAAVDAEVQRRPLYDQFENALFL